MFIKIDKNDQQEAWKIVNNTEMYFNVTSKARALSLVSIKMHQLHSVLFYKDHY